MKGFGASDENNSFCKNSYKHSTNIVQNHYSRLVAHLILYSEFRCISLFVNILSYQISSCFKGTWLMSHDAYMHLGSYLKIISFKLSFLAADICLSGKRTFTNRLCKLEFNQQDSSWHLVSASRLEQLPRTLYTHSFHIAGSVEATLKHGDHL